MDMDLEDHVYVIKNRSLIFNDTVMVLNAMTGQVGFVRQRSPLTR